MRLIKNLITGGWEPPAFASFLNLVALVIGLVALIGTIDVLIMALPHGGVVIYSNAFGEGYGEITVFAVFSSYIFWRVIIMFSHMISGIRR